MEENFDKWNQIKKNVQEDEKTRLFKQLRMFSSKRLLNKIGVMKIEDFEKMKDKIKKFID